jgi:hypothetical protein
MAKFINAFWRIPVLVGMLSLLALLSCQSPQTQPLDLGAVRLQADAGWRSTTPSSQMRKAQFTLPRAANDAEDAELVVFYFGQGQGGSVEANLQRWYGQFSQPDSSSSAEKAKVSREVVDGLDLTSVDLSGTFVAPTMPGNDEHYNKPSYRMLAAVLETSEGPYFFKLVGPEQTIAHWEKSFHRFMKSAKKSAN